MMNLFRRKPSKQDNKLTLEVGKIYGLFYSPQMIKTVEITDIVKLPDGDVLVRFESKSDRYVSTIPAEVFKSMHEKALGYSRLTRIDV
jgi:hypothetical protein